MDESKRAVPYSRGQALADEFRLQFFETSAKNNTNVDDVFQARVFRTENNACRLALKDNKGRQHACTISLSFPAHASCTLSCCSQLHATLCCG
jgi:hypothetical protein